MKTIVPNMNPDLFWPEPVYGDDNDICELIFHPIVAWLITEEGGWRDVYPIAAEAARMVDEESPIQLFNRKTGEWEMNDASGKGEDELLSYMREEHARKRQREETAP